MSEPGAEQGLLSDLEILQRLVADGERCIFVSPLIDPMNQLGPSSLDLHVGADLSVTRTIESTHIDLNTTKEEVKRQIGEYFQVRRIEHGGPFVLHPGEFTLASTLEYIRLPKDIAARLEGRSSFGRLGLQIHATAGFVDPGFEGTLTFELINSGKLPVKLRPGIRLGQICFYKVERVQVGYMEKLNSKYGRKYHVELSRVDGDPEIPSKSKP